MRFRLLLALPISLVLVGIILVSAATLVSAIEGRSDEAGGPAAISAIASRAQTPQCDVLRREIHALSHEVTPCELAPECHGSPLLCPVALDPRIDREYRRLRGALHEHCGLPRSLLDFAWEVGTQTDLAETCELAHDGFEAAARGEARPTSYSF
jgi:hypothetical protein